MQSGAPGLRATPEASNLPHGSTGSRLRAPTNAADAGRRSESSPPARSAAPLKITPRAHACVITGWSEQWAQRPATTHCQVSQGNPVVSFRMKAPVDPVCRGGLRVDRVHKPCFTTVLCAQSPQGRGFPGEQQTSGKPVSRSEDPPELVSESRKQRFANHANRALANSFVWQGVATLGTVSRCAHR